MHPSITSQVSGCPITVAADDGVLIGLTDAIAALLAPLHSTAKTAQLTSRP